MCRIIQLAKAIQIYEGWLPPSKNYPAGSVSYRNNNPGNIKNRWGTFLKFKTYEEGFDYLVDYLKRAATGKHKAYSPEFSLLKFFRVYAPSSDGNRPYRYAKFAAEKLGIKVVTKLKELV
jgi:restriction endonuclease S subunit